MLAAGLNNLAGKALSNFDCLGNAASFRYQSGNVGTRAEIASFPASGPAARLREHLYSNSDGDFFNFPNMLLPLHGRLYLSSSYHSLAPSNVVKGATIHPPAK